jgi:hypothetical protein
LVAGSRHVGNAAVDFYRADRSAGIAAGIEEGPVQVYAIEKIERPSEN